MANQKIKKDFNQKISSKKDTKLARELFRYIKHHPILIITAIMMMILSDISAVLPPYFLKQGLDISVPKGDMEGLRWNAFYLGLFLLATFVFSVIFSYMIKTIGQKLILDIRMDILKKNLSLTSSFYDQNPIGTTLTYLTNDVETLREFISEGFVTIVGNTIKVFFILIMMFLIDPILALFAITSIPLFFVATLLFKVNLRNAYREIRKSNATMNNLLVESLTGIKEIILFNHKKKSVTSFDKGNINYQNSFLKVVKTYSLYFPVIEFVSFFSMISILYSAHLYSQQEVQVGEIFAFFAYIGMFFRPLRDLAEQLNTFQAAMSAAERIFNFIKFQVAFKEVKKMAKKDSEALEKVSGKIVFNKVHFSYVPQKQVISNVSFTIKPGETIAIVGSTGSGKTTLTALLNRLYDIKQGTITIDGVDIKKIPFQKLRSLIATIPQDVFLFTGDFYENIDLNNKHSHEEIMKSTQQVGIHDYINGLKNKFNQDVLEEGKSLSTGQKQLISFARAFLKDAPIIILDEATANIDSESEKKIQSSLNELIKTKTSIIIAHRLSTIKHADRILVMHQGKLVEQGNHRELFKNNGIYKKLYEMQSIQSEH